MTLLDAVLFLPLAGFLLLMLLPKQASRMAALVISLAVLVVSLGLLMPTGSSTPRVTPSRPIFSGSATRPSGIMSRWMG